MPDKAGEFLNASRIITENGGQIKRVSYNKAVDAHTLFVDISAEEKNINKIEEKLYSKGYLNYAGYGKVLLISIKISYTISSITEPLNIIEKYQMNISYIYGTEK